MIRKVQLLLFAMASVSYSQDLVDSAVEKADDAVSDAEDFVASDIDD